MDKDLLMCILSAVAMAPPECERCISFCAEGRISCECQGDFHPDTCENSLSYDEKHTMEEFMYGQDMGNPEDGSL